MPEAMLPRPALEPARLRPRGVRLAERPGLGKMLIDAIGARDYPLAQGAITVFTMTIIAVNLVIDMLYAVVDPRISYR